MGLKPGAEAFFRLMPGMEIYRGSVISFDDTALVLRPLSELPPDFTAGRYVIIPEADSDYDYYTEVMEHREGYLHLKRLWTGKRGFFRVDDVFPVIARKVTDAHALKKSRTIANIHEEPPDANIPDGSVSPQIWKMLADINSKLGLILEKLYFESEGLSHASCMPVNISASGLKLTVPEHAEPGDILEVKMSLPVSPPIGIVAYGEVTRASECGHGHWEVALQFINMDDDVRDEIIHYTFKRQREINRKQ